MGIFADDMNLVHMAIALFWTMLFLQSGLDKLIDWKGNIGWLKGHFEKSFLSGMVKPMVAVLALFELIAGALCAVGGVQVLLSGKTYWLAIGLIVSIVSLLMLFFGQRMAKDYEGAKTIAIYFGVALLSIQFIS